MAQKRTLAHQKHSYIDKWVILLDLVHTRYLQFSVIFHNSTANEHGFLTKTSKTPINTPK